jgi:AraC-like DNA-binding protein
MARLSSKTATHELSINVPADHTQRRVTINDIARQAGVSKTAVSFAFKMPGRLSTETTERILEIARRLGYAPTPLRAA